MAAGLASFPGSNSTTWIFRCRGRAALSSKVTCRKPMLSQKKAVLPSTTTSDTDMEWPEKFSGGSTLNRVYTSSRSLQFTVPSNTQS